MYQLPLWLGFLILLRLIFCKKLYIVRGPYHSLQIFYIDLSKSKSYFLTLFAEKYLKWKVLLTYVIRHFQSRVFFCIVRVVVRTVRSDSFSIAFVLGSSHTCALYFNKISRKLRLSVDVRQLDARTERHKLNSENNSEFSSLIKGGSSVRLSNSQADRQRNGQTSLHRMRKCFWIYRYEKNESIPSSLDNRVNLIGAYYN